jgi:hypothetical protein
MGNDYDRIIKENIEAVILPLLEKLLGLERPGKLEHIPDELQLTLERKPDFNRLATAPSCRSSISCPSGSLCSTWDRSRPEWPTVSLISYPVMIITLALH